MIDIGLSKMALIGAVALIVIGPEKLPRVARTVGTLLGKAQRYVAEVKAEVNRSMELEELMKMKAQVETAAQSVEQSIHGTVRSLEEDLTGTQGDGGLATADAIPPSYQPPRKNWRLKRGAVPQWYKARNGVRTKALSGAARVARYRPKKFH